jgi:hypothetical protein
LFYYLTGGILHDVHCHELKPNGTFHVEAADCSVAGKRHAGNLARLDS